MKEGVVRCTTCQGRGITDSAWQGLFDSSKESSRDLAGCVTLDFAASVTPAYAGVTVGSLLRTGTWTSHVIIGALGSDHDLS